MSPSPLHRVTSNKEPAMTFEEMQHRVTTASALGLLLIASASYAQTVAAANNESTMTSQLQSTTPTSAQPRAAAEDTAIRPFRIRVPEAELVELRRRIMATRWPEKETVADHSQGVPLAMVRELARYWATDYDHTDADGQPAAAVASALSRTSSATGELTRDEILDTVTLYWLTNTGVSLQQGRQGRPLRRVGAAPALRG